MRTNPDCEQVQRPTEETVQGKKGPGHTGVPIFVHCDDSWVVVGYPGLTLSYTGLVPFRICRSGAGHHQGHYSPSEQ